MACGSYPISRPLGEGERCLAGLVSPKIKFKNKRAIEGEIEYTVEYDAECVAEYDWERWGWIDWDEIDEYDGFWFDKAEDEYGQLDFDFI